VPVSCVVIVELGGWETSSGRLLVIVAESRGAFVETAEPVVEAVEEGGVRFEEAELEHDEEDEDHDEDKDKKKGAGGGG